MILPAFSTSEEGSEALPAASGEVRFGSASIERLHALEDLFTRNSIPEITTSFDPFPLTAEQARQIVTEPRGDGYFLLEEGGALLGFSMLRGASEGYEVPSFGIFIDHDSQRRGLGRKMTEWTLDLARRQGAPAVRLSVYGENTAARCLYASLGFAEVERAVGHASDREKIVMRLEFRD